MSTPSPDLVTSCEKCGVSATDINDLTDQIDNLRVLLRAARHYVYEAECPYEHLYDDQQALLEKIDEAAPEPPPAAPAEVCGKEMYPGSIPGSTCINIKGHEGECDDLLF